MSQIVFENVSKSYVLSERTSGLRGAIKGLFVRKRRVVRALREVSFFVKEGECVAYLGPNGAGKSTTIKVLAGILYPDSGRVSVLGRVPFAERTQHVRSLGVVFGSRTQLWWDLPLDESFALLAKIYGVEKKQFTQRREQLACVLQLEKFLHTPVRQLSLGQRMRAEIAAALLHEPKILLLDEPTIGLDAVTTLALRRFLKEESITRGTTIILTTHNMDDVKELCDRVLLVGQGRLLLDGPLEGLRTLTEQRKILRLHLREALPLARVQELVPGKVIKGGDVAVSDVFEFEFTPGEINMEALFGSLWRHLPVSDFSLEAQPLEHVMAQVYAQWSAHEKH